METDLQTKVQGVIEQITHQKVTIADMNGDIRQQLDLDSMQMVQFITLLEYEFKTEFSLSLLNAATVNDFFVMLEKELN